MLFLLMHGVSLHVYIRACFCGVPRWPQCKSPASFSLLQRPSMATTPVGFSRLGSGPIASSVAHRSQTDGSTAEILWVHAVAKRSLLASNELASAAAATFTPRMRFRAGVCQLASRRLLANRMIDRAPWTSSQRKYLSQSSHTPIHDIDPLFQSGQLGAHMQQIARQRGQHAAFIREKPSHPLFKG
jgi:hypothetical protein